MQRVAIRVLVAAAFAAAFVQGARGAEESAPTPAAPIRIVVIGDSTVCNFPAKEPHRGWGQYLQGYFKDSVKVINLAQSGRSSKTFITEGLWQQALREKPNFVLIQFGHNDNHGSGKPESTDAATDYKDYLRRYVADCRAIGAKPVFVTSMCRRNFGGDGKLQDTLRPYAAAMKEVAAENKAAVIDLHTMSGELFQKLGDAGCVKLASSPADHTHFNAKGAQTMAALVMRMLPKVEPELAQELRPAR
jgi:lysophospholipase L1-like esterase